MAAMCEIQILTRTRLGGFFVHPLFTRHEPLFVTFANSGLCN